MRTNGLIWAKVIVPVTGTETGFDADGNPIVSLPVWGIPIKCCIQTLSDTRLQPYQDGKFRNAGYEIHIEVQPQVFNPSEVKLNRYGEDLGEFSVKSIELLPSVGRIKIIV